jgi:hypothetical protein
MEQQTKKETIQSTISSVIRNEITGIRVQFDNMNFQLDDTIRDVAEPGKRFRVTDKDKDIYTLNAGNIVSVPALRDGMVFECINRKAPISRSQSDENVKKSPYVSYRVGKSPFDNYNPGDNIMGHSTNNPNRKLN